jgi:xanthine dehydrogenase YagS FAD-binding subunit
MRPFSLVQPPSLNDLVSFLAGGNGQIALLAGGTDLYSLLKDEIVKPEVIVDLSPLKELAGLKQEKDFLRIGALTTINDLASSPIIQKNFPGLRQAAQSIGSPQLRNVGTVGGNLCQRPRCWYFREPLFLCRKKGGARCFAVQGRNKYHAIFGGGICNIVHPSDLAPALISLEARVKIVSREGEKEMALSDFFSPPSVSLRQENKLQPGEVLTEIIVPQPSPRLKSIYLKFTERGSWDFAVVSVAAAAEVQGRTLLKPHFVLGGVAPIPWRLTNLEKMIEGQNIQEKMLAAASLEALKESRPMSENAYKIDLAAVLLTRAAMSLISA